MTVSPAPAGRSPEVTHRRVAALALPMMVAHATEPLLGIVATGAVGRLGDAALIGGVALASVLFSFLFWAFGGLRMSTAGLVAQAWGAGDDAEMDRAAARALLLAAVAGLLVTVLQLPIAAFAFPLFGASEAVTRAARDYYDIRVWTAPAVFLNYAVLGLLIGRGRTGLGLAVQVAMNLANIALTLLFVAGLGLGVRGAAFGNVGAELVGVAVGLALIARLGLAPHRAPLAEIVARAPLRRTLVMNGDFMIRSMALLFAFAFFNAQGARHGDVTLAVNALLFHLFSLSAYLLDGFATASETLCGQALGARDRAAFRRAVTIALLWAHLCGLAALALTLAGGVSFVALMTTSEPVRAAAAAHLPFVAAAGLLGAAAFVFDGVYAGATWTAAARNAMVAALAIYLAAWFALRGFGNAGLWSAFLVFLAARGVGLWAQYPRLARRAFADGPAPPGFSAAATPV